ncbi:ABC transporter ATP-binding protein [Stygiolobus caldivivus]|uniref:Sugar ABC transporter ATP-binding protein n=1 Tax=Stygiolobus caldivivus TaxID=2824673 RepID=A0A8D5U4U2_9CREN|nr:ABC transporter ATP-binding protein [Stygiolobus caldivivus]BCU68964.1 sugar ABC transporter ATP-binding protein [Stygiolobus caldivivus]
MSVELQDVKKIYRGSKTPAVDGITLKVEKGEFFVILGPSGSGKTTLLRLISGLERPNGGKIKIDGEEVSELPPSKRNIGMVFQNYALYPHKTVLENLIMPLEGSLGKKDAISEAEEISKKLGIYEYLGKYPSELSGGQQQRVALARAILKRPKVFLMDEPLSNLDAPLRVSARKLIKDIQRENGITTIYVTHDHVEAMAIADRVAIMNNGRIIQVGTPEEVYNDPVDEFVATFFGNPPMKIISGRVLGLEGKIGIRAEDIEIGDGELVGKVTDVEFWGDRYLAYVNLNGDVIPVFVSYRPKVGSEVKIKLRRYKRFL